MQVTRKGLSTPIVQPIIQGIFENKTHEFLKRLHKMKMI
jgi:hypothetical protein